MTDTVQYTYNKNTTENGGTIYGLFGIDQGYKYKMTSVSRVVRNASDQRMQLEPIQYIISITRPPPTGATSTEVIEPQRIYLNPDYSKSDKEKYNALLAAAPANAITNTETSAAVQSANDENTNTNATTGAPTVTATNESNNNSEQSSENLNPSSNNNTNVLVNSPSVGAQDENSDEEDYHVPDITLNTDVSSDEESDDEDVDMFGGRNHATRSFRLNRPHGEKHSRRIYR